MNINKLVTFPMDQLLSLYQEQGWSAYTKDIILFEKMFAQSLAVYAATTEDNLIGIIRVVGDDAHILVIQDILVSSHWQRQGVGKALMHQVLQDYKHVRHIVLMTDEASQAEPFYRACGFKRAQEYGLTSYVKID